MKSAVLILPADLREKGNALAVAMGWGPEGSDTYSVPFSADGSEPATHYGLQTWVTEGFFEIVTAAGEGEMPPELAATGYPPADLAAVMAGLFGDIADGLEGSAEDVADGRGHIAGALSRAGLQIARPTEEIEE